MNTLSEKDFLAWAKAHGIERDPAYPAFTVLEFAASGADHARFWCVPREPERRPDFIDTMLELMGTWTLCYVRRRSGRWPKTAQRWEAGRTVELAIVAGLGLPLGTIDTVAFERDQVDVLLTLIFANTIFALEEGDDLYIVPNDANCILMTDYHGAIHVMCREAAGIDGYVEKMTELGYPLPTKPPDETFKVPTWMKGG